VGNVGAAVVDFTALGDVVNVAARMQRAAAAGELLVASGIDDELVAHSPRRRLELRGRRQPWTRSCSAPDSLAFSQDNLTVRYN
jgi:adenylate cyclase